jgi:hypothetical protein
MVEHERTHNLNHSYLKHQIESKRCSLILLYLSSTPTCKPNKFARQATGEINFNFAYHCSPKCRAIESEQRGRVPYHEMMMKPIEATYTGVVRSKGTTSDLSTTSASLYVGCRRSSPPWVATEVPWSRSPQW